MCSIERPFEQRSTRTVGGSRYNVLMDTEFDSAASTAVAFPRRTDMSSIAFHPTYRPMSRPASVRLTRRGRIVVTLLFLGLALSLLTAFGARVAATNRPGTPVPTHTVVVGEGDTLWQIASAAAKPGHTREMLQRIIDLNALSDTTIHNGQELAVPVGR
jgi:LysM repeat protein